MTALTTGDNNTVIGSQAGVNINSGGNNTLMGVSAGDGLNGGGSSGGVTATTTTGPVTRLLQEIYEIKKEEYGTIL